MALCLPLDCFVSKRGNSAHGDVSWFLVLFTSPRTHLAFLAKVFIML